MKQGGKFYLIYTIISKMSLPVYFSNELFRLREACLKIILKHAEYKCNVIHFINNINQNIFLIHLECCLPSLPANLNPKL